MLDLFQRVLYLVAKRRMWPKPKFTLDLLGPVILEMREEMRAFRAEVGGHFGQLEQRLDIVEATLNRHQDELTVTTAMVMRHAAEPIAWGAMQRELKRLQERVDAMERRDGERETT